MTEEQARAIFDPTDRVYYGACKVCGSERLTSDTKIDRFGYLMEWSTCEACTFSFLNPGLTPTAWMAFYNGPYRQLVDTVNNQGSPWKATERTADQAVTLRHFQRGYAASLERWLKDVGIETPQRILDAGGSTGVVGDYIRKALQAEAELTVLDPCMEEMIHSRADQIISSTLETLVTSTSIHPTDGYDLILCCQTIDHCYDPLAALTNLRSTAHLSTTLLVDYLDLTKAPGYKLDHPSRWTTASMSVALHRAGWESQMESRVDYRHQMILAVPAKS